MKFCKIFLSTLFFFAGFVLESKIKASELSDVELPTIERSFLIEGKNFYEYLGISQGATGDQIQEAAEKKLSRLKKQKKRFLGDEEKKKIADRIANTEIVRGILLNDSKKHEYDTMLSMRNQEIKRIVSRPIIATKRDASYDIKWKIELENDTNYPVSVRLMDDASDQEIAPVNPSRPLIALKANGIARIGNINLANVKKLRVEVYAADALVPDQQLLLQSYVINLPAPLVLKMSDVLRELLDVLKRKSGFKQ